MIGAILLSLSFFASLVAYPLCKSDTGSTVDSWFIVKGPKGTESLYYDGTQAGFVPPTHDLNSTTTGALASTLKQLWSESTTDYIIFNDEPPTATTYNFTVGHTKGVWAWNVAQDAAIVLQHSVPKFPLGPGQSSKYVGLGSNAWMYGQHMACRTFTVAELATLAAQAQLTVPDIYDRRISASAPVALQALAEGATSSDPVCTQTDLPSVTYFAKSSQWNDELYASCIAPHSNTSLLVESWIRGSAEGPFCGPEQVLDVQNLSYSSAMSFSEYNDHSKWAVSTDGSLVCASDINRMTTQYQRGGSAFCFDDATLATALRTAIQGADQCSEA
jgi:deoxyribonuclease-2